MNSNENQELFNYFDEPRPYQSTYSPPPPFPQQVEGNHPLPHNKRHHSYPSAHILPNVSPMSDAEFLAAIPCFALAGDDVAMMAGGASREAPFDEFALPGDVPAPFPRQPHPQPLGRESSFMSGVKDQVDISKIDFVHLAKTRGLIKQKLPVLKAFCKQHGLLIKGNKPELVNRILNKLGFESVAVDDPAPPPSDCSAAGNTVQLQQSTTSPPSQAASFKDVDLQPIILKLSQNESEAQCQEALYALQDTLKKFDSSTFKVFLAQHEPLVQAFEMYMSGSVTGSLAARKLACEVILDLLQVKESVQQLAQRDSFKKALGYLSTSLPLDDDIFGVGDEEFNAKVATIQNVLGMNAPQ